MPPITKPKPKPKPFVCDIPGCTWGLDGGPASYAMPQHLGLHKYHKHGIKGETRLTRKRAGEPPQPRPIGRPPKNGSPPQQRKIRALDAEEVCRMVLETVSPSGTIPIDAIGAYNDWVMATEAFMHKMVVGRA